ncbi:MAG: hypothetical protein JWP89_4388 [Schlesneria sp.]|nr:hypothetical protein [Schlesneria sp.]
MTQNCYPILNEDNSISASDPQNRRRERVTIPNGQCGRNIWIVLICALMSGVSFLIPEPLHLLLALEVSIPDSVSGGSNYLGFKLSRYSPHHCIISL